MKTTQPSSGGASSLSDLGVTSTAAEINALHGVKRYVALLTQSGTSAPVATVLENSLGATPVLTRIIAGVYRLSATGMFPELKTAPDLAAPSVEDGYRGSVLWETADSLTISTTADNGDGTFSTTDGALNRTKITVEVYP